MREVVIASAARTPIGSYGGTLKDTAAVTLGAIAVKEAMKRAGIAPEMMDEVVLGCVLQAGQGQNVARQVSMAAGIPQEVPSMTINKVCGSGLRTVGLAAQMIKAGDADIVVCGGTESMSNTPYAIPSARWGARMNDQKMVDLMVNDGLWDVFNNYHMGVTAENIVEQWGLTREEQDEFAMNSQLKAEAAIKAGKFKDEIVPVEIPQRKGDPIVFDTDEYPKFGASMEKMAKLRPAFKKDGSVTAGNSSGINDGASFTIIASETAVHQYQLPVMAEIRAIGQGGVDPNVMGMGPVPAIRQALNRAGLKLSDIELIELNEAFAAQSIGVVQALSEEHGMTVDEIMSRTNVNGGAIALGHPVGVSGNRIVVSLIHEMIKRDLHIGLASLCIGGGMGTAIIIQR